MSHLEARERMVRMSWGAKVRWLTSLPRIWTLLTRTTVRKRPEVLLCPALEVARAR